MNHTKYDLCAAMKVNRGMWLNHVKRSKGDRAWHVQHRREIEEAVKDTFDEYRQILGSAKLTVVLRISTPPAIRDMKPQYPITQRKIHERGGVEIHVDI